MRHLMMYKVTKIVLMLGNRNESVHIRFQYIGKMYSKIPNVLGLLQPIIWAGRIGHTTVAF